ncbi:hypothetical protein C9I57_15790 [Trinickia symbiotica]|uniref:Lactonase family protein n=1 Tax=Trinickia symbiotica TaxID=863227 RepID=A0A2T3XTM3_9BURK|nr:lactonase family protein [Trinickia symbiotica]PTB19854.1 hypothetical protein C9I57_15790 [Trinickia symbiotica]
MNDRIDRTLVFAGCLNRPIPHFTSANGNGIAVFSLDEISGRLSFLAEFTDIDNPTYLAVVQERRMLYATSELIDSPEGFISAVRIDAANGALTLVGQRQRTRGRLTAWCATDARGEVALVANYARERPDDEPRRHVASFSILADGTLTSVTSEFTHEGRGPRDDRQSVPHAHCAVPSPDNRFVIVADLGTDELTTYRLDQPRRALGPANTAPLKLAPGSGPRHLTFHSNGAIAYVICELANAIDRLAYDRDTGELRWLERTDMLPAGAMPSFAAGLVASANGRQLYASLRGEDSVITYALEEGSGRIVGASPSPSGGKTPRSIALSPSGKFLLVANQDSDLLASWRLDPRTGIPLEQADSVRVGTPMCVQAATFRTK